MPKFIAKSILCLILINLWACGKGQLFDSLRENPADGGAADLSMSDMSPQPFVQLPVAFLGGKSAGNINCLGTFSVSINSMGTISFSSPQDTLSNTALQRTCTFQSPDLSIPTQTQMLRLSFKETHTFDEKNNQNNLLYASWATVMLVDQKGVPLPNIPKLSFHMAQPTEAIVDLALAENLAGQSVKIQLTWQLYYWSLASNTVPQNSWSISEMAINYR